jgi:hypothetical protein
MTETLIDLQLRKIVDMIRYTARTGAEVDKYAAEIEASELLDRPHHGLAKIGPGHVFYFDEASDETSRTSRLQTWAVLHAIVDGIEIGTQHKFTTLTVSAIQSFELTIDGWKPQAGDDVAACDFFVPVDRNGFWETDQITGTLQECLDAALDAGDLAITILCAKCGVTTMVLTEQDRVPAYQPVI